MSSRAGETHSPAQRSVQHEVSPPGGPAGRGSEAGAGLSRAQITAHQLHCVPSMNQTSEKLWRSIDELTDSAHFQEMLHREFPDAASEWTDEVSRRRFLKLM